MQEEKQGRKDPGQEVALERYRIIAPLLEPGLEKAEMAARRQEILSHGQPDTGGQLRNGRCGGIWRRTGKKVSWGCIPNPERIRDALAHCPRNC